MHRVFLGLGGNMGDKASNFKKSYQLIEERIGSISRQSSIYETPPWGFKAEENFWNQVLLVESYLEALEILWRIKEIEDLFGRKKTEERYSSRPIDIDILYFDDVFMETKNLIVPHPRLHERRFALVPLVELDPDYKHPLLRMSNLELLSVCRDESIIKRLENPLQ